MSGGYLLVLAQIIAFILPFFVRLLLVFISFIFLLVQVLVLLVLFLFLFQVFLFVILVLVRDVEIFPFLFLLLLPRLLGLIALVLLRFRLLHLLEIFHCLFIFLLTFFLVFIILLLVIFIFGGVKKVEIRFYVFLPLKTLRILKIITQLFSSRFLEFEEIKLDRSLPMLHQLH